MVEFILKYNEHKKQTPEGSALVVKMLIKEGLLELICAEDLSEVPLSDTFEIYLLKALKKRAGMGEELPDVTIFVEIVHAETKMEPGEQNVDGISNLKTDCRRC